MKILIDYKLENWNETINHCRYNRFSANQIKKQEMQIIGAHIKNVKPITKYPIKLMCTWHVKNLNSDLDNKSLKNVLDEMQILGILKNDNIKHINEINHKAIKDEKDFLEIDIIEQ